MAITFSSSVVALAEAIHQTKCFKPSMLALHIFNRSHSACSGVCGTPRLGARESLQISETKNSRETSNFTQNTSIGSQSARIPSSPANRNNCYVARRRQELKSPWRCCCAGNPASSKTKSTQLGKSLEQWAVAAVRSDKKWGAWGESGLKRLENARLKQLLVINLIFAII